MFRRSNSAGEVHGVSRTHLAMVSSSVIRKIHGSWLRDAASGPSISIPFVLPRRTVGSITRACSEETQARLARRRRPRPNSTIHSTRRFVDTLARSAAPPELPHYFFIDGGALAIGNALKTAFDWKVRKNLAAGRGERGTKVLHLESAFHGRSGYTMSLTNTDPRKTDHYPKFDWPRIPAPKMTFPFEGANVAATEQLEQQTFAAADAASRGGARNRRHHVEPIRARRRQPLPSALFQKCDRWPTSRRPPQLRRVQTGLGFTGAWGVPAPRHPAGHPLLREEDAGRRHLRLEARRRGRGNVFQQSGRINSTWGGSLVDMVRCKRLLEIIVNEKLIENAAARGAELLDGLVAISRRFPW